MLRRTLFSGQFYLWIFWLFLLVIYVTTVSITGEYASAVTVFLLLIILYLAEGMEIAAATLIEKQTAQFESKRVRSALETIKRDVEWFFAQRQIFVVTIVTAVSLMTTFGKIYVPFYRAPFYLALGSVSLPSFPWKIPLPFWFALIFTSFTILWWCQVFPKRLALRNSVVFLDKSASLMWPIKGIGSLNLPGPADQLVWLATKYTSFKDRINLKPSRSSYYDTAVMLYGFAIDHASADIGIRADGSAVVTQKALLILVHGGRTSATGSAYGGSPFLALPTINVKSIHTCPLPEKLELINDQLDRIFNGQAPSGGALDFKTLDPNTALKPDFRFNPAAPGPNEKKVAWTIDWGIPLPGGFREKNGGRIVVALLYEVKLEFGPDAYAKDDYFTSRDDVPCRKLSLRVHSEGQPNLRFGIQGCAATLVQGGTIPFHDETARVNQLIRENGVSEELEIEHPMQGTTYQIDWHGWPA